MEHIDFPNDDVLTSLIAEWNRIREAEHDANGPVCAACKLAGAADASKLWEFFVDLHSVNGVERVVTTAFILGQIYGRRKATEELAKIVN